MDTIWLKIAGFVVVIIAIIIGVMMFMPPKEEQPTKPQKTFGDMIQKDKKIIAAEPNATDVTQQAAKDQTPQEPAEPVIFYFTELNEAEKIGAENLFATVPSFKSIGRLPYMGYNTMVQACRQLMSRFPGSIYDYKARRALAQVPEHYWTRYKITEELIDLTQFTQQRPNTYPYKPQEDD